MTEHKHINDITSIIVNTPKWNKTQKFRNILDSKGGDEEESG